MKWVSEFRRLRNDAVSFNQSSMFYVLGNAQPQIVSIHVYPAWLLEALPQSSIGALPYILRSVPSLL